MDSRDTEDRRQRTEDREKQKQKQKQEQKHRQKQWIPAIQRTEDRGQRTEKNKNKGYGFPIGTFENDRGKDKRLDSRDTED
jgi:hypothetical protein